VADVVGDLGGSLIRAADQQPAGVVSTGRDRLDFGGPNTFPRRERAGGSGERFVAHVDAGMALRDDKQTPTG
jgi:hypothetical protein